MPPADDLGFKEATEETERNFFTALSRMADDLRGQLAARGCVHPSPYSVVRSSFLLAFAAYFGAASESAYWRGVELSLDAVGVSATHPMRERAQKGRLDAVQLMLDADDKSKRRFYDSAIQASRSGDECREALAQALVPAHKLGDLVGMDYAMHIGDQRACRTGFLNVLKAPTANDENSAAIRCSEERRKELQKTEPVR